jgi:hypothetical protein
MARTVYDDRIEVFAFASTGLSQALREAASLVDEPRNKGLFDTEMASITYHHGTHHVVLPYAYDREEDDSYGA